MTHGKSIYYGGSLLSPQTRHLKPILELKNTFFPGKEGVESIYEPNVNWMRFPQRAVGSQPVWQNEV